LVSYSAHFIGDGDSYHLDLVRLEFPSKVKTPNPAVQLTATSHGLRHMTSGCLITPSLWLLSHPSCRRSTLGVISILSQVAVADFVR